MSTTLPAGQTPENDLGVPQWLFTDSSHLLNYSDHVQMLIDHMLPLRPGFELDVVAGIVAHVARVRQGREA